MPKGIHAVRDDPTATRKWTYSFILFKPECWRHIQKHEHELKFNLKI